MRIFISHKLEDAVTANLIAKELKEICSKYNTQRDLFKSLDLKKILKNKRL